MALFFQQVFSRFPILPGERDLVLVLVLALEMERLIFFVVQKNVRRSFLNLPSVNSNTYLPYDQIITRTLRKYELIPKIRKLNRNTEFFIA